MRAKWTYLLATLAAVALVSPYGQAQPASPIAAPVSGKELIVATKEAPALRDAQRRAARGDRERLVAADPFNIWTKAGPARESRVMRAES